MSKSADQAADSRVRVAYDQAEEFRLLVESLSPEDRKILLEFMKSAGNEKTVRN
jgi:hypothetical protein